MSDISHTDLDLLNEAVEPARLAGADVKIGGITSMLLNQPEGGWQEGAGIVLAMVVLLLAFGSYLAAGIPILVSLCALAISYSVIHFLASMFEIAPTAPMVAAMLGIGAGIDYALFIVTRYRQQLAEGDDVETAVGRAMAHAGHAVVFAGGTVVFAICGLFLAGIAFVGRIGITTALAITVMVVAALTLLPAILGSLGERIDRYKLPACPPGPQRAALDEVGTPCRPARLAVRDRRDARPAGAVGAHAQPAVRGDGRQHGVAGHGDPAGVRRRRGGVRRGALQPVRGGREGAGFR